MVIKWNDGAGSDYLVHHKNRSTNLHPRPSESTLGRHSDLMYTIVGPCLLGLFWKAMTAVATSGRQSPSSPT